MKSRSEKIMAMVIATLLLCQAAEARKRALTVFVGDYPEDSGWTTIHSTNDKTIILRMLGTLGFQVDDIICLENSAATRKAIC